MRAILFSLILFAEILTNAEIVKLVDAGLSPATIEAKIAVSETKFDTTTDALVALKKAGVPDSVIRSMIERRPKLPVPLQRNATAAAPIPAVADEKTLTRRYDVAIHRTEHARCAGELRIDGKGVRGSRCKELDFDLAWADVRSLCYDYGFRGTIVIGTAKTAHRISTETPAEAKRIIDTMREVRPALIAKAGC